MAMEHSTQPRCALGKFIVTPQATRVIVLTTEIGRMLDVLSLRTG